MDQIVERKGTRQWTPQEYNLAFEREITGIEGNNIFIDNPVVMQMDKKFGGGEVYKYTFDGRISEVGISDMCIESEFEDYEDLEHGWIAVELDKVENCWVKILRYVILLTRLSVANVLQKCFCYRLSLPGTEITDYRRISLFLQ